MPTSKGKNLLYRCMLPAAPRLHGSPVSDFYGHKIEYFPHLKRIIRHHHISGGAFLFSSGSSQSYVYTKAYHTSVLSGSQIYFRVASVTKMATALLAFRLQEKGCIDLSAPVLHYLPEVGELPELKDVTLLHLLSHTSGLADPPDLESMLIHHTPFPKAVTGCRYAEPGASFRYSNLGYGLLGCVYEAVLNAPLGRIYEEELFARLSMNASIEGSSLPPDQIMPVVRILPYHPSRMLSVTELGKIPLTSADPLYHYGHSAGSMYTDLPSLYKLLVCIRDSGAPLLSSPHTMKRQLASYGAISPTLSYGAGLLIIRDPSISASPVYGHQGFAYGCVDGAFWEDTTGNIIISLNGGCSEARKGRLGAVNADLCRWAFKKELPTWT